MEKKNTLLLTVIAVATLLVAVVGATFAYFAGTTQTGTGLNITATTEPASSSFIANSTDALELDITADKMLKATAANDGSPVDTDTGILTVSFASAKEGTAMYCTYDVVFTWTGDDKYTAHSGGVSGVDEFTVSYAVVHSETSNTTEGTASIAKTETDQTDFADISDIATKATIFKGAKIWSNSTSATTSTYTFTSNFYNIDANQSDLSDSTFKGNFAVENVVC